jgi:hypothetical protein
LFNLKSITFLKSFAVMTYLVSTIVPSLKVLKLLGRTDQFKKWLESVHGSTETNELFEGYKYAVKCCLNSFLDGISNDYQLKIKNDFLFERALHELIPLHKIENTCEKTIFLKRIKPFVKDIHRSHNLFELKEGIHKFQQAISLKFEQVYDGFVFVRKSETISKTAATKLVLINFVHTCLIQISNDGPTGNWFNPLSIEWTKEDKKEFYLAGYKYAIQFIWLKILGEKTFQKTSLSKIHEVDSWRNYKYQNDSKNDSFENIFFEREFDLAEQNSLDSFFFRLQEELTKPLDAKHKYPTYEADKYLEFRSKGYKKRLFFGTYLKKKGLDDGYSNLPIEGKILNRLYWMRFEVINARELSMHLGTPSFNTMLAGTVALHRNRDREFDKVMVAKFTHPHPGEPRKNDYSYGILIDSMSAAGHYHSGWVIYQNTCGDYSGFSGSEHKATERLIKKYLKVDKIILRELTISLQKFKDFTRKNTLERKQTVAREDNPVVSQIIQEARSLCFEFLAYYISSVFYKDRFNKISMNKDKTSGTGELDVLLENDDEVLLIECKLNGDNQNIPELIKKLNKRVSRFPQKSKSFRLWFWYEPSTKTEMLLKQHNHIPLVVSKPEREEILRNVDLKRLKFIMQDYTLPP